MVDIVVFFLLASRLPADLTLCFLIHRLSSIDTKYHIWKLGVVLTDNVSQVNVAQVDLHFSGRNKTIKMCFGFEI